MVALANIFKEIAKLTESEIDKILPISKGAEVRLLDAMRYSSMSAGKRVRPLLVVASGDLFGVDRKKIIRVGQKRKARVKIKNDRGKR